MGKAKKEDYVQLQLNIIEIDEMYVRQKNISITITTSMRMAC